MYILMYIVLLRPSHRAVWNPFWENTGSPLMQVTARTSFFGPGTIKEFDPHWGTGWDFRIAAVNPPSNPSLSLHYFLITDLLVLRSYVPHSSRVSLLKFQLHHHRALVKKSFNAFPSWLWKKSRRPPMATDLTGITLPVLQTHSLTFFVLLTSVM